MSDLYDAVSDIDIDETPLIHIMDKNGKKATYVRSDTKDLMMFGYSFDELLIFAYACREAGIETSDLQTVKDFAGIGFETGANEASKAFRGCVHEMIRKHDFYKEGE